MTGLPSYLSAFTAGLGLCFGLIVAIGAQNAFVLRQGLRREHLLPVVLFCFGADTLLVLAGVAGMARVLANRPTLAITLAAGGAVFLFAYAALALRRAWRPHALQAQGTAGLRAPLKTVMLQLAAFTLLNPHVYLDTVVLIGSVGAAQPGAAKWFFAAGTALASLVWFSALGFGARFLAPWLARPGAWRWLDAGVGLVMAVLGGVVARQAWSLLSSQ
ncbi:amino acid transporter [Rhodoferax koreense]|uniref:Amino acid transporter n=1 Tax=Rhodoferax koreensis TaxID=1842727 RepID=A0A1P8JQ20_9BURK|nr:LysE/ArgO family amino acid transporter [Rhodoferax koreense]APW35831.1 amino acid transporter [Rhodoferax koreense]